MKFFKVACALDGAELQWMLDQIERFVEFLNREIVSTKASFSSGGAVEYV